MNIFTTSKEVLALIERVQDVEEKRLLFITMEFIEILRYGDAHLRDPEGLKKVILGAKDKAVEKFPMPAPEEILRENTTLEQTSAVSSHDTFIAAALTNPAIFEKITIGMSEPTRMDQAARNAVELANAVRKFIP